MRLIVVLLLSAASALPAAAAQTVARVAAAATAAPILRREEGALIFENVPARNAALAERLDRYLQSRGVNLYDWTADGALLIGTRFGDSEQVHRLEHAFGAREQLTFFADPISGARAPRTLPAERFLFLKDSGGNENAQIYSYQAADRTIKLLTDGKSLNGGPVWAHDGKRVAFHSNRREPASYDIYVLDTTTGSEPRLLVGAQQDTWYALDWSPDDSKVLVWKYVSISESYLYVADAATGTLTPVDQAPRKYGIGSARFAPDGRGVYYTSDEGSEFLQLRAVDLVTHESRVVTADIPWDIEAFDISPDGRYLAYSANEDGRSRLTVLDLPGKLELAPPGLPDGTIGALRFDRTGRRLALSLDSPIAPRDVYVFDVEHNALQRWTKSEAGPVNPALLAAPRLIRYPTWDRGDKGPRMLSAYYYQPATPGPHPVLVYLHGGPESQYRAGFDPFFQFLVQELGYAVIAPNVRGSSGYGKTFLKLDDGEQRADAVKDVGFLLAWVGTQPALSRDRIVVMGGSYGGYLALASLATYGDRLRGGIDVVGITNFVSFLENTSVYRRDLRRAEYGDERDPRMRAFFNRISPLANAAAIRKPLLVVQGLNDPRVPASESQQLVARVRAVGGEVWYLAAKDEGHGFRRKSNRDAYLETAATFLERLAQ